MSEIKRGMLKFYHRGLLNKKWKDYKFILYDSSLLTWYSDLKHKKPDGMVLLKDVERYICIGPYTRFLPDFPHLDNEYDHVALIAFPMSVKDRDRDIVWILCQNVEELNSWVKAIIQTLPSHTLHMEQLSTNSSVSTEEEIQTHPEFQPDEINTSGPLIPKADTIGLPLVAGLIGNRLQGHAMNSKDKRSLENVGYNYADTTWGTGQNWNECAINNVPEYAEVANNICYINPVDLIHNEVPLSLIEDRIGEAADYEEAVYELSKNKANNQDGEDNYDSHNKNENSNDDNRNDQDDNISDILHMTDELQMIDSDTDK